MARVICAWAGPTAGAAGCTDQPGVQLGGIGAAAVPDRRQPRFETFGREPVGPLLAVETGQEPQADRGVQIGEQTDRTREHDLQVGAELVGHRDPVGNEILSGAAGLPQRDGRRAVRDQRPEPSPVGAQRIGQDEGVESVVLVAGRPVPAAQVLDLVRADHHHGEIRVEQCLDDGAVRPFDGYLPHPELAQSAGQGEQCGRGVFDGEPVNLPAVGIDHGDRVVIAGPVKSDGQAAFRYARQGVWGRLHHSLLAASPSGEAPLVRGAGTRLPVRSLFGARWRSAL
jgi:hypothetical protein